MYVKCKNVEVWKCKIIKVQKCKIVKTKKISLKRGIRELYNNQKYWMMTMLFKKYIHSNTAFCILFYLKFLHFTFLHFYTFHLLGALLRQFQYSLPEKSVHLQCSPVRNTAIACIYVPFCDYNSLTFCLCYDVFV